MIDWREIGFALALIALMMAVLLLSACMGASFTGICAYQPLGVDERNVPYLAVHCEASPKKEQK